MSSDEHAIRMLIDRWIAASAGGDLDTVLDLMTDDVVFLVAGQKPFGKEQFAAASRAMTGTPMKARSELQELEVVGDWAWCRTELYVTVTPPGAASVERSGPTLTIFRRDASGKWRIARDANLLTRQS